MMTEIRFLEILIKTIEANVNLLSSQIGEEEPVKNIRECINGLKDFLSKRDTDGSFTNENYKRKLEQIYDELDSEEDACIPVRRLIQLFVKLDEEYNHQPWDLLQILRCIDVICPIYVDDEEEE